MFEHIFFFSTFWSKKRHLSRTWNEKKPIPIILRKKIATFFFSFLQEQQKLFNDVTRFNGVTISKFSILGNGSKWA